MLLEDGPPHRAGYNSVSLAGAAAHLPAEPRNVSRTTQLPRNPVRVTLVPV